MNSGRALFDKRSSEPFSLRMPHDNRHTADGSFEVLWLVCDEECRLNWIHFDYSIVQLDTVIVLDG